MSVDDTTPTPEPALTPVLRTYGAPPTDLFISLKEAAAMIGIPYPSAKQEARERGTIGNGLYPVIQMGGSDKRRVWRVCRAAIEETARVMQAESVARIQGRTVA